jgi:hypothetical protein
VNKQYFMKKSCMCVGCAFLSSNIVCKIEELEVILSI